MKTLLSLALTALLSTGLHDTGLRDADDVLAHLKAHQKDVALITPGIRHNAHVPMPFASAIKILHLEAYADAVRAGSARSDEKVQVARWNAYHLPGTDGGAHEAALNRLRPGATVTLDQLVSAMIEESDNAAADLLRDRLRLHGRVPTINGEILKAFGGCPSDPDTCLKNYVTKGEQIRLQLPGWDRQAAWADRVTRVKPSVIHRTLTRLTKDELARKHLEWPMRRPGAAPDKLVIGAKGGALPGVVTEAMYTVKPGREPVVTVLALRRLPAATWTSALESYAHQQFILRMNTDPAFHRRVRAALK
ncbi:serine hydrolase [Thermoactinospora rubra]|uniref:serine hydrolase n=1 Tax=Thermoactinospora rubra TaxID=1088767 RepID=UPI000A10FCE0|nr:serine hydrolase [Thermoactinospora rubra]